MNDNQLYIDKNIKLQDFYFCYDSRVAKWLRYDKGFNFLFKAIHPNTNKVFHLFIKSPEIDQAIAEYLENQKSIQL